MCHTHTPGGSESPSGCQDNVTTATTVTMGTKRHFHPAYCGTCFLGHSGVGGDENAEQAVKSVGPEPALRNSRQNIRKKIKR